MEHADEFECFKNYFIALKPDSKDSIEDSKDTTFVQHLKDPILPNFSDEECYMDRFNTEELMRSEIKRKASKLIIDRFEDKPKNTFMTI